MGIMDSLKSGIGKVKEGAEELNQKRLDNKNEKLAADESKRCGTCDHFTAEKKLCSKHNKVISNPTGIDGEYCTNWSNLKQKVSDFKESYNQGKLQAIHEDATKRCFSCDHYIDGTRMCKKHNKKISRACGPDGEFCIDGSDLKQSLKTDFKKEWKNS